MKIYQSQTVFDLLAHEANKSSLNTKLMDLYRQTLLNNVDYDPKSPIVTQLDLFNAYQKTVVFIQKTSEKLILDRIYLYAVSLSHQED